MQPNHIIAFFVGNIKYFAENCHCNHIFDAHNAFQPGTSKHLLMLINVLQPYKIQVC